MNPSFDELIATFKYEEDAEEWIAEHRGVFRKYYIIETERGYEVFHEM